MVRTVVSIVVGYIVIALATFIGLTGAWLILGADRAFEPGVYDLSLAWVISAVAVNIVAAVIGGVVCASIARTRRAPIVFAFIVFVLGIIVAVPVFLAGDSDVSPPRPAEVTMFEAIGASRQPAWFALLNPVTVAAGIMIGAALVGGRSGRGNSSPH